ncbi:MAG: N-(5'-phosphoribosyl)anthranilate isomerase, partial [Pseudomonadota bacterium]
ATQAAIEGGIVRRKVRDVERLLGRERFEYELRRRGFQAVENAGQFVIFCNAEPVRRIS